MAKEYSLFPKVESVPFGYEFICHCKINLIVSANEGPVCCLPEIESIPFDLVDVRRIGSVAVVSVHFSDELVGFVAELSLNHILEPEFVQRISYFLEICAVLAVSEPKEKERLQLVPLS
jgi:hypothetical protein